MLGGFEHPSAGARMRKVPLMLIAICAVVAAALALSSSANATTRSHGSHVRRAASVPTDAAGPGAAADAAGPGAAAVAAVRQAGIAWRNCGKQLQCAKVSVP